eukprot:6185591-Pleurochrysis_carterae.AAC.4
MQIEQRSKQAQTTGLVSAHIRRLGLKGLTRTKQKGASHNFGCELKSLQEAFSSLLTLHCSIICISHGDDLEYHKRRLIVKSPSKPFELVCVNVARTHCAGDRSVLSSARMEACLATERRQSVSSSRQSSISLARDRASLLLATERRLHNMLCYGGGAVRWR